MNALYPGDILYVHDQPYVDVDYQEYDLTPARGGTGAPCLSAAKARRKGSE